jgi:hypothetical protein
LVSFPKVNKGSNEVKDIYSLSQPGVTIVFGRGQVGSIYYDLSMPYWMDFQSNGLMSNVVFFPTFESYWSGSST